MLKVLSNILCDLDPKVKVIGQKAGICDGVPSTSALVTLVLGAQKNRLYETFSWVSTTNALRNKTLIHVRTKYGFHIVHKVLCKNILVWSQIKLKNNIALPKYIYS